MTLKIPFICLLLAACGCVTELSARTVYQLQVSTDAVGATPEVLGYNIGHTVPTSNTFDWLRYTEVNGFRLWSSPVHIEPTDDTGVWGDGVHDRESFLQRRSALRADPLNHEFINWPMFERNFASVMDGTNRFSVEETLRFAQENNITPLVMIHRGVGRFPFRDTASSVDWASRWETWQHFYAQVFWMARHFDVERFQVYNEPDHIINIRMSQEEYLERMKISSDAVQAAIADVNKMYGKNLTPRISAPVTVAAVTMFHPRPGREGPDQRAAVRGWGELSMEHRRKPFFDDVSDDFTNFQVYAYQQYGPTGPRYGEQYQEMRQLVKSANNDEPLPVIITEFNVLANYMFRRTEDTMHTPGRASRLGSILINLINEQPDELYVFKFGQTMHATESYLAKNGNFWQDNDQYPFHTGGSTRGAEVYRLIMRAFQRDRQLLQQPVWQGAVPSDTWVGASHDPATDMFHLFMVTERATEATAMQLDLSPWGIQTPGVAILEEVSKVRHGSVRTLLRIPEDGKLNLELSPETTWHLIVPRNAFGFSMVPVAQDAYVQAGRSNNRNFGDERVLKIRGHSSRADQRQAAYLKFDLDDVPRQMPRRVLLRLHTRATAEGEALPAHVYGLIQAPWTEGTITSANAPLLRLHGGNMRHISDNRVDGAGSQAFIQGTVTAVHTPQDQFIDVTDYVRAVINDTTQANFLITQEVRYSGELIYRGGMEIVSREGNPAHAPQLLFLY
ncbi:MAG: DNRLRE domain-containing protein [Verrucomicrobia bacterium]|nr:DNRLRE domain-containing protein [Verrucomicrobiota bacterium]